jgi:hypothetical protein
MIIDKPGRAVVTLACKVGRIWLVVATVSVIGTAAPRTALAGNGDGSDVCGTISSRFAGTVDPLAYTGFYSHLDPQVLKLCTGDAAAHRGSFSWSAIETSDFAVTYADSIVQIGLGSCYSAGISGLLGPFRRAAPPCCLGT